PPHEAQLVAERLRGGGGSAGIDHADGATGEGRREEPFCAVAHESDSRARVAAREPAGHVRRAWPLEQQHAVGRTLVLQARGRREGANAQLQWLQPRILHPPLIELTRVLYARAGEVEQNSVVERLEDGSIDADAGAAKQCPVLEVTGVRQVDARGPQG